MANGRIIGPNNFPASSIASGIWSLTEQLAAIKAESWPTSTTPTVNYINLYTSTSALTSYSFTTATLDPGLIVVVVHSEDTVEDSPASSVTIGGNSATQAIGVTGSNVNSWASNSIWYYELSSSTTSVTVTFGLAPGRAAIAVYRILNYSSTTPYFTGSDVTASVTTRSVTTSTLPRNSVIIAAQTNGDGAVLTTTWSDITEQYDTFWGTSTGGTGGSLAGSDNTSYTITSTNSSTTTQGVSLAVAVWR